ncbi:hypothetical protein [Chondromyces crocatus]|uniref:Uncharacterized protein n=1 Tax=Chondromyces crocatus TaxID=52 RepID=A0A0K1E5Y9_CHOCO|nr:hypothetical protein [Chondromyces crocatus]AKT36264.1 uncharacterized protein CMC5_003780 [Chondromyces crocatus]
MSTRDDRDDRDEREDPKDDLKQGLGLLWRAARSTANGLRKDLDRTQVGRALDDAGRELVRAASNVVGRLGDELKKRQAPGEAGFGGFGGFGGEERDSGETLDPAHPPDGGAPLWERQRPADGAAWDAEARDAEARDAEARAGETRAGETRAGEARTGEGGMRFAVEDDEASRRDEPNR